MLRNRGKSNKKALGLTALALGVVLAALVIFLSGEPEKTPGQSPSAGQTESGSQPGSGVRGPSPETGKNRVVSGDISAPKEAIDYKALEEDGEQKALMEDRKKKLGIKKSLDMIVKSDESFKVGESTVSMQDILEKAFTREGEVYEQKLTESGTAEPAQVKAYGIYVVQPGDNLWNIHFGILRDYYADKGIAVEARADEPGSQGFSSGIGKILKFSETMVIIYNMVEEKVVQDINLLEPLSKVVVYNMEAVFNLLKDINYDNVNRIQFDGKNIWIPAKKS